MKAKLSPYLFIMPHLFFFIVFIIVPFVTTLYISLCQWDLINEPVFIGMENYRKILFDTDSYYRTEFLNGFGNTIKFVIFSIPPLIIIPLLFAVGLNDNYRGKKIHQAVLYFPTLLSVATVVITWKWLFDRRYGLFNNILHLDIPWTNKQPYVWLAIIILSVWWGAGVNMVIYISGLTSIPKMFYEAANIDGANGIRKFFHITLPLMKEPLLFTTVMTTIASFNIYGQPLMLTGGGPAKSVRVLMMVIRDTVFGSSIPNAGVGSAMAVMLGLCIIIVSALQFIISKKGSEAK